MSNHNQQHWQVMVQLLREIADKKQISINDISDKTGIHQSNVSRIFSLKYCPSLNLFLSIAKALEINFFFTDREDKVELNQLFEKAMNEIGRRNNNIRNN